MSTAPTPLALAEPAHARTPRLPALARDHGVLLAIAALGLLLRTWAVLTHGTHESADQHAYALLGLYVSEHGSYGGPLLTDAFHWPPGAPLLFAAANLVAPAHINGAHPDVPAAYVVQAVLGSATVVLAALVAGEVGGRTAAWLTGAAVALYPPLVLASGTLLSEPLAAVLITAAVLALARALRRPAWWRFAACGALLGLTALTRADQLAAPVVLAAVALVVTWRAARAPRAFSIGAVVLAAALVVIAPWVVFAHREEHRWVPVSSGGASNLFIGTYLPGGGTIFGLKHAYGPRMRAGDRKLRHTPDFRLKETTVLRFAAHGHRGARGSAVLQRRGLHDLAQDVTRHTGAFAAMLASKVGRLWLNYTHGTLAHARLPLRIGHLVLVGLSLLGLAAGLASSRQPVLLAIAALLLYATALNAVLVAEARHLLPLLPLLFAAGAGGGVAALRSRQGS